MIERPGWAGFDSTVTGAVTRVWMRLLLVDGMSGVAGVGCGRVAARLTYGAQAPGAPGDMMIDWVIPRPRGCDRSVSLGRPRRRCRRRRDKCVPGAGRMVTPSV